MQLPRMTTRRWMIAVAGVGLAMGGMIIGRRLMRWRDYLLSRAALHSKSESEWEAIEDRVRTLARDLDESMNRWERTGQGAEFRATWLPYRRRQIAQLREDAEAHERRAAHYAALARKYRQAARYPWLSVEPDPPEPK